MAQAQNVSRRCEACAGRRYLLERTSDRAVAKVCACAQPCSVCGGKGHVLTTTEATYSQKVGPKQYEVLSPCVCRLLGRRVARYNEGNVPGVLAHADFESYRAHSPGQDRARSAAQTFAHGYRRGQANKGYILSGPVGTGKTHLLASTLGHLILELGVAARYVEISLLYSTIRRGFQEGKSGGEIIGPLSEVEVLAIDELGKGRGSQFELETLDELIARRYNAGRTTLFATNYSLEYDRAGGGGQARTGHRSTEAVAREALKDTELLRERVGERIYSRLCEMCEFVQLPSETPDMRRARHELRGPRRS